MTSFALYPYHQNTQFFVCTFAYVAYSSTNDVLFGVVFDLFVCGFCWLVFFVALMALLYLFPPRAHYVSFECGVSHLVRG